MLSFAAGSSSVKKGESLRDTVETIEAMGVDAVVVRHASAGAPHQVARWVRRPAVINAGDGWHEHPTQALLDCYTVRQALAERGGADRRRAPSWLRRPAGGRSSATSATAGWPARRSPAFAALGAEVTLVAPAHPAAAVAGGLAGGEVATTSTRSCPSADVVSLLRLQARAGERGLRALAARVHRQLRPHRRRRGRLLPTGPSIMHPGPMIRGVEIAADVADLPAAVITGQVANGVAVRMAVLFLLLGAGAGQAEPA